MKRAEGNLTNIICVGSPEVDETRDRVSKVHPRPKLLCHSISKLLTQDVFFDYNKILAAGRAITFHRGACLPKLRCLLTHH